MAFPHHNSLKKKKEKRKEKVMQDKTNPELAIKTKAAIS